MLKINKKRKQSEDKRRAAHNTRYKTLGFMWLCNLSATH
jgi:hypothetical protein